MEDREEQGRENAWCKVRGRTQCGDASASSSTHRGRVRVSACQPPPPPDKDQNTRSEEPGSCSPPLKAAGRGETSRQSTEGPVLPLGPQRTVSPLTTAQERRVPLPSRQPGGGVGCGVCVWRGFGLSPLTDPGRGEVVVPLPFPSRTERRRKGGGGCVC